MKNVYHHSEETKKKISIAKLTRDNSNYRKSKSYQMVMQ
jgi:hypothetical protein